MEHIYPQNDTPGAVGEFAGGIAHDFNNLLSVIKGRASLMMNTVKPSDPIYHHLTEIFDCIDKGSEITNQLLGFAKVDAYYTCTVDVNRLVRRTVETIDFGRKKIDLDVDLGAKSLMIEADPDKINQVFMSIIDNAQLSMPNGGKLSISTERISLVNGTVDAFGLDKGLFVKVTFKDTGIGMTKNVLEKIFTPFYSADHTRYPYKKGLGLTFSREIVQNHNGVIDVWSSPNAGSSFSVILPLKETIETINIPGKDEKPFLALENEQLLIVDDEERILKVGREICKSLGYTVITVNSGKEAIKVYREKKDKIDLVILDMIMPEMNGLETFLELKKLNPDIKTLLSTGYSIDEKALEMLRQGCKGYILKPYNIIDFSRKLREVIAA